MAAPDAAARPVKAADRASASAADAICPPPSAAMQASACLSSSRMPKPTTWMTSFALAARRLRATAQGSSLQVSSPSLTRKMVPPSLGNSPAAWRSAADSGVMPRARRSRQPLFGAGQIDWAERHQGLDVPTVRRAAVTVGDQGQPRVRFPAGQPVQQYAARRIQAGLGTQSRGHAAGGIHDQHCGLAGRRDPGYPRGQQEEQTHQRGAQAGAVTREGEYRRKEDGDWLTYSFGTTTSL